MWKTSLQIILLSLLALGLTACAARGDLGGAQPEGAAPPAPTPITVCYSGTSSGQIVAWYAYENQLFAQYGLDVSLVLVNGGSNAVSTLIAGESDICQVGGPAVVNAVAAGEDLVIIGGLINRYTYSLVVTPDVEAPEDLKGRAIAIGGRPGGVSDTSARAALGYLGLEPEQDVALVTVGQQPDRLAALEAGDVAGTMVAVPVTTVAEQQGFKRLVDLSTLDIPFQQTSISTTRDYLEANREDALNFMRAIIEATAAMKRDEAGVAAVMAEYMLLDPEEDAPALSEAYDVIVLNELTQLPYPTLEGLQASLDTLETQNPAAANLEPGDFVDTSLVEEIEASGFVDELYE